MINRREHARVNLDTPVRIFLSEEGDPITGTLHNLSMGGMFIGCTDALPLGTRCRVEVVIYEPGDSINIWVEGLVVRVTRAGVALQITAAHQESFSSLRDLLLFGGAMAEAV